VRTDIRSILLGVLGALFFTVAVNTPRAYAQAMATGVSVDVLAALVGQNVSAAKFLSSAPSGEDGFSCATAGCRFRGAPSGTSGNAVFHYDVDNGWTFNAAVVLGPGQPLSVDNLFSKTTSEPIKINGTYGQLLVPRSTVDTCGTTQAPEGVYVQLVSTASSATRVCHCIRVTSGGVYHWQNADTLAYGSTTTDCPETT
jgi:hypothetical protein